MWTIFHGWVVVHQEGTAATALAGPSRMRGVVRFLLAALCLCVGAACSDGGPASSEAEATSTTVPQTTVTVTVPSPGTFTTFLVDEGLAAPIEVEGEPERRFDDPVGGAGETVPFWMNLQFPDGWESRGLTLASWSPALGFHELISADLYQDGVGGIRGKTGPPDFAYELWLIDDLGQTPLRRLFAVDTRTVPGARPMQFAPGYETVNDLLTKPPPSDGNYLIPADTP